ncbi:MULTISPECIES: hypothetical protein [Cupriavidus]|nr:MULTISPECIES: hypothetical protein [Cupriavidus]
MIAKMDTSIRTTEPLEPAAEEPTLIELARIFAEKSSQIPDIIPPYVASSLVTNERRYYYVAGKDREGRPRLFEVFLANPTGELDAVPACLYPGAVLELFPTDLQILAAPDPWGGKVPDLTTTQIADGLQSIYLDEQRNG